MISKSAHSGVSAALSTNSLRQVSNSPRPLIMGQSVSQPAAPSTASGCPVKHDAPAACPVQHNAPAAAAAPTGCPVKHDTSPAVASTSAAAAGGCPVDHGSLNPLNNMPNLSQAPATHQTMALPTERTSSSIPRDDSNSKWEYPSPQQFYNALVRKGWETPEEHVETMVEIHNFLNEQAWLEVLKWEKRVDENEAPQLTRFMGRPGQISPKARFWLFAGWLLPDRFNTEPPFDRHDWVVRRPRTGEEVRYVIDYYEAAPEADGSPVFSLDVRPALDSFGSIKERIAVATEEAWTSFRDASPQQQPERKQT